MEKSDDTSRLFDEFFESYKLHLRNIYRSVKSGLVESTHAEIVSFWNNLPAAYIDMFKASAVVLKIALYDKTYYRSVIWAVLSNPFEYECGPMAQLLIDVSNKYCEWTHQAMSSRLPEDSPLLYARLKIARLFCVTLHKKASLCSNAYLFLSRAHEMYCTKHDMEDIACGRIGETECRQMFLDLSGLNVEEITATATPSSVLPSSDGLARSIYHDVVQLLRDCADMPQWACWMCNLLVSPILPEPVMAESYGEVGAELSSGYWFVMFWKTVSSTIVKMLRDGSASTSGLFSLLFAWLTSVIEYFVEYRQAVILKSRLDKLRSGAEVEIPSSVLAHSGASDTFSASSAAGPVEGSGDVLAGYNEHAIVPGSGVDTPSRLLHDESTIRQWHVPYREG